MLYKWVTTNRSKKYHAVDSNDFWNDIILTKLISACGRKIDSCYDDYAPNKDKCKACLDEIRKKENLLKRLKVKNVPVER